MTNLPPVQELSEWVLVPREPTEAMCKDAAAKALYVTSDAHRAILADGYARIYRDMISASPASPSPATGVRVKALEWKEYGGRQWIAPSILGSVSIMEVGGRFGASGFKASFDTLDAAKSAHQSRYDAAVRSALVEQP